MKLQNFAASLKYLYSFIPKTRADTYSADWGLSRTKYLLKLLGNPQNKLKVIHIAGTSGKGSTAYLTSLLLKSLGQKVGLALSPHLVDIRERMQVNNRLISKQEFSDYLNQIRPAIEQTQTSRFGKPTYFELVTVLAFYIFYKQHADFAVVETGLGGLYDATNSVDNLDKLAVITKIGLDHTAILGKTISKITFQKAGIIHSGNTVFSIEQEKDAKKVLDKTALVKYITKGNFTSIKLTAKNTLFNFHYQDLKLYKLELGMLGEHQAQNAALALAVTYYLSQKYNFKFNEQKIREALAKALFPGRFEIIHIKGNLVIVDGAHNPQKMVNFLTSVKKIFPGRKFNFLVAFKKDKDYPEILQIIKPLAKKIFLTSFFTDKMDLIRFSEDPKQVALALGKLDFTDYVVIKNNKLALEKAINEGHDLIVTGSLYLLGDLYLKLKNVV